MKHFVVDDNRLDLPLNVFNVMITKFTGTSENDKPLYCGMNLNSSERRLLCEPASRWLTIPFSQYMSVQ